MASVLRPDAPGFGPRRQSPDFQHGAQRKARALSGGVESRESAAFPSGKTKNAFAAVCSLRGTRRAGRGLSRPARREQSAASCSCPRRQSSILDMERSGKPLRRCRESKSDGFVSRSEEHTSELQSPCNLVCRLLLEK